MTSLRMTARMYFGAPRGRLGLRGAAARRSATWPLGSVSLGATSHTCGTLWDIGVIAHLQHNRNVSQPVGPAVLVRVPKASFQRVSVARALIPQPRLILAEAEPSPPLKFAVVAPSPAPTLPRAKSLPAAAAAA